MYEVRNRRHVVYPVWTRGECTQLWRGSDASSSDWRLSELTRLFHPSRCIQLAPEVAVYFEPVLTSIDGVTRAARVSSLFKRETSVSTCPHSRPWLAARLDRPSTKSSIYTT